MLNHDVFKCILVIMQKIIIDLIDCVLLEILFQHISVFELYYSTYIRISNKKYRDSIAIKQYLKAVLQRNI